MDRYVVGFLFHENTVLLARKRKPDWQRGLLNGIGGKIEPGEAGLDAMMREGAEEVKLTVGWEFMASEAGPGYMVYFYRADWEASFKPDVPPNNDVGEVQGWIPVEDIGWLDIVGNLRWLIPMALDWRRPRARLFTEADIQERPTW